MYMDFKFLVPVCQEKLTSRCKNVVHKRYSKRKNGPVGEASSYRHADMPPTKMAVALGLSYYVNVYYNIY